MANKHRMFIYKEITKIGAKTVILGNEIERK